VFSFAACAIEGNARSTGPKGTVLGVCGPSILEMPASFVLAADPFKRLSLDNGKDMSRVSALFAKALALLNSSIVHAVLESGIINAEHPMEVNGTQITTVAMAGCTIIINIKITIMAFATIALTCNTLLIIGINVILLKILFNY
jgi:hypothetical protein